MRATGTSARRSRRDDGVRDDEHRRARETEREAVHDRRGHREQRAQAEQLDERDVVAPESRGEDGARIATVLHRRGCGRLRRR